jgi:hypothetical protein
MSRVIALLALSILGCATGSGSHVEREIPVTSFGQVAGAWVGWLPTRGGQDFRVRVIIEADGSYNMHIERDRTHPGKFSHDGRRLYFRHGEGTWAGTVPLLERGGEEYLRFVFDNGTAWTELHRVK